MSNEVSNIFKREAQTIGESLHNIKGLSAQALEETKIIADSLRDLRQIPEELKQKYDQDIENLPEDIGLNPDITNDRPDLRPQREAVDLDTATQSRPTIDGHEHKGL